MCIYIHIFIYTHTCVQKHIFIFMYIWATLVSLVHVFSFLTSFLYVSLRPVIAEVRGWAQVGGPFTINGCQGQSFVLKRYFLITENRDFPLACQFTWGYYVYCIPNHPPMVMNGQHDSHQAAQRFPSMSNLAIYSKPRCPRITQRMRFILS